MLYKPTSPSPYAESVVWEPSDKKINFSCSTIGSNIEQVRLKISDRNMQYYFDSTNTNSIIANDYGATIEYDMNVDTACAAYSITNSDAPVRAEASDTKLSDIISSNNDYKWQIRLYEKDSITNPNNYRSNIWLGYGAVSVYDADDEDNTANDIIVKNIDDNNTKMFFKIRPHTNIFCSDVTNEKTWIKKTINGRKVKFSISKFYAYYDDNARYYIRINGKTLDIKGYYFYDPSESDITNAKLADYFDNYGEPKDGYVVVDYDEDLFVSIREGDNYEIYCNYIDSDEFYFNTIAEPSLSLSDISGIDLSPETITETNPLELTYSSLIINGVYSQSGGATVNYYRATLSLLNEAGVYEVIDDTGNVYSSALTYSYNKLLNGEIYKLTFTTCDTNSYKLEKTTFIKPKYKSLSAPLDISVTYNAEHDSNIIDFSNVVSISAKQTDLNIGYNLYSINDDGSLGNDEETHGCIINDSNSFTYDTHDGGSKLSFINPLVYMQIRVATHKTGLITRTTDDNGVICTLIWDGYNLIATWDDGNSVSSKSVNIVAEGTSIIDEIYVYAWNDDGVWDNENIWYENSPLSDNWWTIILTRDDIYAKMHGTDTYKKGA